VLIVKEERGLGIALPIVDRQVKLLLVSKTCKIQKKICTNLHGVFLCLKICWDSNLGPLAIGVYNLGPLAIGVYSLGPLAIGVYKLI